MGLQFHGRINSKVGCKQFECLSGFHNAPQKKFKKHFLLKKNLSQKKSLAIFLKDNLLKKLCWGTANLSSNTQAA